MKNYIPIIAIFLISFCDATDNNVEPTNGSATDSIAEQRQEVRLSWVTPVVQVKGVEHATFFSTTANNMVSYHIYRPPTYQEDAGKRFPVMYWLHGGSPGPGTEGIPALTAYFDKAIQDGLIPPMIIVYPHSPVRSQGNVSVISMWVDSKDNRSPIETVLIKELIPHIDSTYRTIASKEGRAIDGFSMGGYGAARLGFKYNDLFTAISILGAGPMQATFEETPRMPEEARRMLLTLIYGGSQDYFFAVSPRKMAEEHAEALKENIHIRIAVGDRDETFPNNVAFHEHLTELNIPHDFIVARGIPHNPMQLLEYMQDSNWTFYRKVFASVQE